MQVAIIGPPGSGKTTVFDAVTRARRGAGHRADRPSLGVAKVDDPRLDELGRIAGSARVVPAEITFLDLPASADGLGIGGESLTHIQRTDALAIVVRGFEDPSVPHALGRVDALADAAAMLDELALADMQILEKRLDRLSAGLKGARVAERAAIASERDLLGRLAAVLDDGARVSDTALSPQERAVIAGFGLLTAKPTLIVVNVSESQAGQVGELVSRICDGLPPGGRHAVGFFGLAERDLSDLDPSEEEEFRDHLGIGDSGPAAVVSACLDALQMICFFTVGPKEAHARMVKAGTGARAGAGAVHSDMERGFIRAEIVPYDDFVRVGGETAARREGLARRAGADHVLRDGDVVRVLFSV